MGPGPSVTTDTLLLGSSLSVEPGTLVVDLGCGPGGAMDAARSSNPDCSWLGIDLRYAPLRELVLARGEAAVDAVCCDVLHIPWAIRGGIAGAVIMNPPFVDRQRGRISPSVSRAVSRSGSSILLHAFVRAASHLLRSGGQMLAVARPAMLPSLLLGCRAWDLGPSELQPVGPAGGPAVHILLRCLKGAVPDLVVKCQRSSLELTG